MNKKGLTIWEILLFTVFLAIAVGSSVFFFFLSSNDVQIAQQKYNWIKNINLVLDEVTLEIANAAVVDFPFDGQAADCFFRASTNSGSLEPMTVQEGFSFSENSFVYVARRGTVSVGFKRFGRFSNPLISGCREGKFTRTGPDRIEISFNASAPDNPEKAKEFHRIINLRNQ